LALNKENEIALLISALKDPISAVELIEGYI
jgi:hypothetical protein